MTNALVAISDIERMADAVAKSKLFGCKNKEEAMSLMLISQAEGMHPMTAVQEFHIIQGRPARKAESMLARFQNAGGKVAWHTYSDTEVSATFSHPQGGEVKVMWTITRAKAIGLAEKDNWKKYPAPMLRSRCISEGVRTVYPGATGGMYTPEELEELPPTKDMGAIEGELMPRAKTEAPAAPTEPQPKAATTVEPSKPTPAPAAQNGAPMQESQIRLIRAKLAAANIPEANMLAAFQVADITALKSSQANQVLDWIKHQGAQQP